MDSGDLEPARPDPWSCNAAGKIGVWGSKTWAPLTSILFSQSESGVIPNPLTCAGMQRKTHLCAASFSCS